MDLAEVHREVREELHFTLAQVMESGHRSGLGAVFDVIAANFEALGICNLLEFADTHKFRLGLVRSGHARRYFLRCCRIEARTQSRYLARSRTRSFLAALASGSLGVARDIVAESTHAWNAAWEYEDDFVYYEFLHVLADRPSPFPQPELAALAARFHRVLEGGSSTRFDVVAAIAARDEPALGAAIVAFLDEEAERIDTERSSAAVRERDCLFWPNARVSIEGLALLKACELAQLRVSIVHPLCPQLGRLPWTSQSFRDVFEQIDRGGP